MTAPTPPPAPPFPGLVFERVPLAFSTFDWQFGPGLHTVLGAAPNGPKDLFELAHGLAKPRRGRVSLHGAAPHDSAHVRRSIASVGPGPLPGMASGRELVLEVARLRGHAAEPVFEQLEAWGLARSLDRPTFEVTGTARSALELALALHHPGAKLLLLWEPFASGIDPNALRAALERQAHERPVLVFLSAPLAVPLPGSVLPFGGGSAPSPRAVARPSRASVWLACAEVEAVARRFLTYPGVSGAEVLPGEPGLLRLRLEAPELGPELSRAVVAHVAQHRIDVRGLRVEVET